MNSTYLNEKYYFDHHAHLVTIDKMDIINSTLILREDLAKLDDNINPLDLANDLHNILMYKSLWNGNHQSDGSKYECQISLHDTSL